jgi:hypothetical protein
MTSTLIVDNLQNNAATINLPLTSIPSTSTYSASNGSTLIGYTNGGTSAVSTTVASKLKEKISVKDFGATGNGTTDDTAAITAALAAASNMSSALGPVAVWFPSGVYLVSSGFTLPTNIFIRGDGEGVTKILTNTANINIFSNIQTSNTIVNIGIEDLNIASTAAGVVGIKFTLCSGTSVRNVIFQGCSQCIVIDRGQQHRLLNIVSRGYGSRGFGSIRLWSSVDTDYIYYVNATSIIYDDLLGTGAYTSSDTAMLYLRRGIGCYFQQVVAGDLGDGTSGNPANFIVIENDCQGCKFSDCVGVYCYEGITLQTGTGVSVAPSCIQFDSCDIDQAEQVALNFSNCKYVTYHGGFITPKGGFTTISPVVLDAGATEIAISGLQVAAFNGTGGAGIYFNGCSQVSVTNSIIDQCYYAFVFATGSTQIRLTDNLVTNCNNKYSGTYNQAGNFYARNYGFNPLAVGSPSVPSSGTLTTNNNGVRCTVYVIGSGVTAYSVNGVGLSGATGSQTIDLEPGDTLNMSYSSAPSWSWVGH